MNLSIVWLDSDDTKVFHFSEDRMERESIQAQAAGGDDGLRYDDIARRLQQSRKILILGPGLPRSHFQDRLKANYPMLAERVIACEEADDSTDQSIAAYALKYLQKPVA